MEILLGPAEKEFQQSVLQYREYIISSFAASRAADNEGAKALLEKITNHFRNCREHNMKLFFLYLAVRPFILREFRTDEFEKAEFTRKTGARLILELEALL